MDFCQKEHEPIFFTCQTCPICNIKAKLKAKTESEFFEKLEENDKEWLNVVTDLEKDWETEKNTVKELTKLNSALKEKIINLEKGIVHLQDLIFKTKG